VVVRRRGVVVLLLRPGLADGLVVGSADPSSSSTLTTSSVTVTTTSTVW
jgi:hypothetical protein